MLAMGRGSHTLCARRTLLEEESIQNRALALTLGSAASAEAFRGPWGGAASIPLKPLGSPLEPPFRRRASPSLGARALGEAVWKLLQLAARASIRAFCAAVGADAAGTLLTPADVTRGTWRAVSPTACRPWARGPVKIGRPVPTLPIISLMMLSDWAGSRADADPTNRQEKTKTTKAALKRNGPPRIGSRSGPLGRR